MPQGENYFDILGIPFNAGFDVIEQGYRRARKQFEEDPGRLKLIEEAYRTLINPFKKEAYVKQLNKNRGQAAPAQPAPEESPAPARRHGTSVFGVEGKSEPVAGEGQKPAGAGRNKTQIMSGGTTGSGRTPEPKPSSNQAGAPRTPEPGSEPAAGKSRSKTQIFTGGQPTGSRTPEPNPQPLANPPSRSSESVSQPPPTTKSGGRSKTQIVGAGQAPVERTPEPRPQLPAEKPVGAPPPAVSKPSGGRTKTVVVGGGTSIEPAKPAQPPAPKGGTVIVPPAGAEPKKREPTGIVPPETPVVPPPGHEKSGRPETVPLPLVGISEGQTEEMPQPTRHRLGEQQWEVIVTYQGQSSVFKLAAGENLVGRPPVSGPTPPVSLPDPEKFISRTHATILVGSASITIRDNGSPNGSVLNGRRMESNQAIPFREGDVLLIEGREIRIRPAGERK